MFSLNNKDETYYFTIPDRTAFYTLQRKLKDLGIIPHLNHYVFNDDDKTWKIYFSVDRDKWMFLYKGMTSAASNILLKEIFDYDGSGPALSNDEIVLFNNTYYKDDVKELLKVLDPIKEKTNGTTN